MGPCTTPITLKIQLGKITFVSLMYAVEFVAKTDCRACVGIGNGKGKGAHEPKAQTSGPYTGFISMNHA